jgi:hypothetical protein
MNKPELEATVSIDTDALWNDEDFKAAIHRHTKVEIAKSNPQSSVLINDVKRDLLMKSHLLCHTLMEQLYTAIKHDLDKLEKKLGEL